MSAQPGQPQLIKSQHVRSLQHVSEQKKGSWVSAIDNYQSIMQNNPQDSQPYRQAFQAWIQLTKNITDSVRQWTAAGKPKFQGQNQPQQGGQPPQQQQMQHQQQQQQSQMNQGQSSQGAGQGQPQQQQQGQPQIPQAIWDHVNAFTFTHPEGAAPGTQQYDSWVASTKQKYASILFAQESHKASYNKIGNIVKVLKDKGQNPPQDHLEKIRIHEEGYKKTKAQVDNFRNEQAKLKQRYNQQQPGAQQQQNQQSQQNNSGAPLAGAGGQQPFQLKLPGQQTQQQNPQSQQSGTNPALEAARNAANVNRASISPTTSVQPQQQNMGQAPTSFAPPQQPKPGMPQQQQPQSQPSSATQQHRPSLTSTQPVNHMQQQHQNSPHSAQPGNQSGGPISLSHQQAMTNAQRAYSDRQTPQSAQPMSSGSQQQQSQPYGQVPNRTVNDHANSNQQPKQHMSKSLPPHLHQPPQAVNFPTSRPTLAGPSNGVGGMLGQPAIVKAPPFQLVDSGDGTGVLSKKKLDELVRQVTGGGEGLGGEMLTPEVEEAMLLLADEFVDTVITAACRLAKLRESQTLDVRDIQLILERNYSIRIPGYAHDEIRAIKKFAPSPAWISKMNAVQAAKVMGGKNDI